MELTQNATTTSSSNNLKLVTEKVGGLPNAETDGYADENIPTWGDLKDIYASRWLKEKEVFQLQLKANFFSLVERFASGKQELYLLTAPERKEKLYINAFLELFESGYAPHIGDVERLAGKKVRKLYVTLPHNYSSE
jgi:hypothetical protein